jgi:hypothetical protein
MLEIRIRRLSLGNPGDVRQVGALTACPEPEALRFDVRACIAAP